MKKLILLLLIISINSCYNNGDKARLNRFNNEYKESLSNFKHDFVSYFPKKLDEGFLELHDMKLTEYNNAFIYLMNRYEENVYDSIRAEITIRSIASYVAGDSCLLVINKYKTEENWYKKIRIDKSNRNLLRRDCKKEEFPVPNFYQTRFLDNTTPCKLPQDFRLFVLEAKRGKYWDDKYLYGSQNLPTDWKHGYSKGFAISDKRKIIIYWFSIW
ncbi:MAG: hypothetical protein K9H48_12320 [Melioribacteraceae bacterium]|nr:hypothetical protein [Melioribacteraceae bacterium]MCF8395073.1 hypothetical protein [Melioribacteraceae bacterium]MCF8420380.1 hypothetical protein [Melioribacteraceae bacterium]